MNIQSFSGCHEYTPACVEMLLTTGDFEGTYGEDDVAEVIDAINRHLEAGVCPRCQVGSVVYPAGSRITDCRCVPICGPCGGQEAMVVISPDMWPVTDEDHWAWVRIIHGQALKAELAEAGEATLTHGSDGTPIVMDQNGVAEIRMRPHPGGWAEFGFDGNR